MDPSDLHVSPQVLKDAADGINGVIGDISGAPVVGSYLGQTGRGFSDLKMTGQEISHETAKAGMDTFCDRWEWGTRALIQAANDIGHALHLGAGMYEMQDDYYGDEFRGMANDLIGDPSLQRTAHVDPATGQVVKGTDDMGWRELTDYNRDRLENADYSDQSFQNARTQVDANLKSMQQDGLHAATNVAVPGAMGITTGTDVASKTLEG